MCGEHRSTTGHLGIFYCSSWTDDGRAAASVAVVGGRVPAWSSGGVMEGDFSVN
jgi:hypothetical protein